MAHDMSRWRRVVLFVGFSVFGLIFLALAFAAIHGETFTPSGSRFGTPKPWKAIPLESPIAQIAGTIVFAIVGVGFMWLGFKALRDHARAKREGKRS